MRAAGQALGNYRLNDTTLYVTLEPCIMCAAAIVHARVRRLVFGAWDQRAGAAGSIIDVFALPSLNHRVDVFGGVLSAECAAQLERFFDARRGWRSYLRASDAAGGFGSTAAAAAFPQVATRAASKSS